MTGPGPVILAEGVYKTYPSRKRPSLDGFSLAVLPGTVHALLGPNGAGKTTAVRTMSTLVRFDSGRIRVAGYDVAAQSRRVRERIGLTGQYAALDEVLSGRRNLEMFARLHHLRAKAAKARAAELLERFGLTDAAERPVRHYSGGMRRRLDLAAGLILDPRVLFLDEPTTGLDPRSRAEVWRAVRDLVSRGTTVLLTTQYLEEADRLADTVSVMEAGRTIAEGTPDELKRRVGGSRVEVTVIDPADVDEAAEVLGRVCGAPLDVDPDAQAVRAPIGGSGSELAKAVRALDEAGVEVEDIALRRPSLDEVFLNLTGHRTGEGAHTGEEVR